MSIYWEIAKYNFLRYITYPLEYIGFILRKLLNLGFLVVFWSIVGRESPELFNFRQLLAYFLIAQGVHGLTFVGRSKFGGNVQKLIKSGKLTTHLIRPVKTVPYLFSEFLGGILADIIYSIIVLIIGVAMSLPIQLVDIGVFIIFWIIAIAVAFSFNILLATLSFYMGEAGSIRNVYNHTIVILSGLLIPISYFPETLKKIVLLTPFPNIIFLPTIILQKGINPETILSDLAVGLFWGVFLSIVSLKFWNNSLKQYEGVGL